MRDPSPAARIIPFLCTFFAISLFYPVSDVFVNCVEFNSLTFVMFYAIDQKAGILSQPAPLERGLAFSAAGKPAFTAVCRRKGAPIIFLPMTCSGVFGASLDVAFRSYLDPLQSGLTTLNMTIFEKIGYILQVNSELSMLP